MRNFYRELGLPDLGADQPSIEVSLGNLPRGSALGAAARFVLLDPVRRQRYDHYLRCTQAMAEVRSRLGSPDHGHRTADFTRNPDARRAGHTPTRPRNGLLWAAALGLCTLVGVGFQLRPMDRPAPRPPVPTSARPGMGQGQPAPLAVGPAPLAGSAEVPVAVPFPDHGWLQLTPDVRPSVPWTIETDAGQDFVLSLTDAQTRTVVLTLYLRGGQPFQGLAPEGAYELEYRSGQRWLGPRRGFDGGGPPVRPGQIYRVLAGPDDEWEWHLRLHPTGCEGDPVAPVRVREEGNPPPRPGSGSMDVMMDRGPTSPL